MFNLCADSSTHPHSSLHKLLPVSMRFVEPLVFVSQLVNLTLKFFSLSLHLRDKLQRIINQFKTIWQISFNTPFLCLANLSFQESDFLRSNNLVIGSPIRQLSFHVVKFFSRLLLHSLNSSFFSFSVNFVEIGKQRVD